MKKITVCPYHYTLPCLWEDMSEQKRKRSWWKWLLSLTLLALLTPVIVLLVFKASTEKAWEQYEAEWHSRDPFSVSHYLPAPVPKSQNLAFHPLFENLEKRGSPAHTWFASFRANPACPGAQDDFRANPATMQRSDLSRIASVALLDSKKERIAELVRLNQPVSEQLDQLSEALAQRPHYHVPHPWHDSLLLLETESSGLQILSAAHGYLLRATLHLHAENPSGAAADITSCLRLSSVVGQDPLLMNLLAECKLRSLALSALWDGLAGKSWSEEDLRKLGKELSTIPPAHDRLLNVIRVSRAQVLGLIDQLQDFSAGGGSGKAPALTRFFLAANRLSYCRDLQECILAPRGELAQQTTRSGLRHYEERLQDRAQGLSKYINAPSLMMATSFSGPFSSTLESDGEVLAARWAIEIELHRAIHGSYPSTLEALTPTALKTLEAAVTKGQKTVYQLKKDGTPEISIEWPAGTGPAKDIVWSYPPSNP